MHGRLIAAAERSSDGAQSAQSRLMTPPVAMMAPNLARAALARLTAPSSGRQLDDVPPSSVRSTVISRRPSGWSVSACRIGLAPSCSGGRICSVMPRPIGRRLSLTWGATAETASAMAFASKPSFCNALPIVSPSRGAPTSRRNRLASRWAGRPARDQMGSGDRELTHRTAISDPSAIPAARPVPKRRCRS